MGAVGYFAGPNLTRGRGGLGATLTDADWERAVRHGVRRDGTPLMVMPSHEFTGMADDDLAAIVAYARSLPPVNGAQPSTHPGPVIRALHLAGQFTLLPAEQIDHTRPHPAHMEPEVTPRYGAYLAAGCIGCHGPGLSGGKIPAAPPDWKPAANLTPSGDLGRWTVDDFTRALRTGRRPDGSPIDSVMPWKATAQMTDDEIKAVYAFLKTVPAKQYGNR